MIEDNLSDIRERIKNAALRSGRDPEGVVLVCVIKKTDVEAVRRAVLSGVRDVGENTVQAALSKYELLRLNPNLRWHFIGHLQTNKVKSAVKIFELIHSVDSIHLAETIDKEAARIGKTQDILLQVNVSGEKTKYGFEPMAVQGALGRIGGMSNVKLRGLMTMAPYSVNPQESRRYFQKLRNLRDSLAVFNSGNIALASLSMGMSGDFEVAIEEGADIVRIGSAIFEGE